MAGREVRTEQVVPCWARTHPDGRVEEARLDVSFIDRSGRRTYVDVSVVAASSIDVERLRRRAQNAGEAARAMEDTKRLRYPGADLVPCVFETLGRPGDAARCLFRSLAPTDAAERGLALGAAWQTASAILQVEAAQSLLLAESWG